MRYTASDRAGKTTRFRLLMGILKANAGHLAIAGLDAFEDRGPSSAAEAQSAPPLLGFAFLAVIAAPISEEYLFRGLLFRALDRTLGGGRAVLWSALYFAIYHPPASWPPVLLAGVGNALLFRASRNLTPCVLAHACYNTLVLVLSAR